MRCFLRGQFAQDRRSRTDQAFAPASFHLSESRCCVSAWMSPWTCSTNFYMLSVAMARKHFQSTESVERCVLPGADMAAKSEIVPASSDIIIVSVPGFAHGWVPLNVARITGFLKRAG